ncbi:hypothetical protein ACHAW6_016014 [Cyclotella cf. meneghiniana]
MLRAWPSTPQNVNWLSKKLTGRVTGLFHMVSNHGRKILTLSFTWITSRMPLNCACLLDVLLTTWIWPSRAHILKPLSYHTGLEKRAKIPLTNNNNIQQVFDKMHALMAADALAAYLDRNKQFDVYMMPLISSYRHT